MRSSREASRRRRRSGALTLGGVSTVTVVAAARVGAQLAEDPAHVDHRLVILLQVFGGGVALVVVFRWALSAIAVVTRLRVARAHPTGEALIGRAGWGFTRQLGALPGAQGVSWNGNPVVLIAEDEVSMWTGAFRPRRFAAIPYSALAPTSLSKDGGRFWWLITPLGDGGADGSGSLEWRVQVPTAIGLVPASRRRLERVAASINARVRSGDELGAPPA